MGSKLDGATLATLRLRTIALGVFATLAAVGTLAATSPAWATTTVVSATAQAVSPAATCNPKLDYDAEYMPYAPFYWGNFCGVGSYTINTEGTSDIVISTIRMPTTPYHRVWFHQNDDGSGLSMCFYSKDTDINVLDSPAWVQTPGNILISANTSPC